MRKRIRQVQGFSLIELLIVLAVLLVLVGFVLSASTNLIITKVNTATAPTNLGCPTAPCVKLANAVGNAHAIDTYFSSPMSPMMFGILNPPPLTAGTPPKLPLTAVNKTLSATNTVP